MKRLWIPVLCCVMLLLAGCGQRADLASINNRLGNPTSSPNQTKQSNNGKAGDSAADKQNNSKIASTAGGQTDPVSPAPATVQGGSPAEVTGDAQPSTTPSPSGTPTDTQNINNESNPAAVSPSPQVNPNDTVASGQNAASGPSTPAATPQGGAVASTGNQSVSLATATPSSQGGASGSAGNTSQQPTQPAPTPTPQVNSSQNASSSASATQERTGYQTASPTPVPTPTPPPPPPKVNPGAPVYTLTEKMFPYQFLDIQLNPGEYMNQIIVFEGFYKKCYTESWAEYHRVYRVDNICCQGVERGFNILYGGKVPSMDGTLVRITGVIDKIDGNDMTLNLINLEILE